ncbi:putative ankyrin repeat protein RF_0381 [Microplitis demolitor]|uniref:putative ankyrin repeat protein RF_0381 n=1 Tax=Microplitis demolitor TaxID=69319 RepID=UPI0006D4CA8C|nr:putative ankyrin repeat protein RF_0381 [Microplitis demolitor]
MFALVPVPKMNVAVSYSEIFKSLKLAVKNGDVVTVERLIISVADESPVPAIINGYALLCDAINNNQQEVTKVLLKYIVGEKSGVNTKTPLYTALHYAILNDDFDITKMLIDEEADIDKPADLVINRSYFERNDRNATVFYYLSDKCSEVSENGQELVLRQCTPLHVAVRNKNFDTIELLLWRGADSNSKNCLGKQPIDIAIDNNDVDMVKLLMGYAAQDNLTNFKKFSDGRKKSLAKEIKETLLQQAVCDQNNELAIKLIDNGIDVDREEKKFNRTLLINAIITGNLGVVKHLLAKGVDVNKWDNQGHTAFHFLFMNSFYDSGNYEEQKDITLKVADLLIHHGANVNAVNYQGLTPLSMLSYDDIDKIEYLLSHNADLNIVTDSGLTIFTETLNDLQDVLGYSEHDDFYGDEKIKIAKVAEVFVKHIVRMLCKNQFRTILIGCPVTYVVGSSLTLSQNRISLENIFPFMEMI